MMIPYKRKDKLHVVHRLSSICDSDNMAMQFEPRHSEGFEDEKPKGFREQQGAQRTRQIMSVFKKDSESRWKLDTEEFLHQVQARMTELISAEAMTKFFAGERDSAFSQ